LDGKYALVDVWCMLMIYKQYKYCCYLPVN
jgi:hypothetical protein